jgi:hypothetical protein
LLTLDTWLVDAKVAGIDALKRLLARRLVFVALLSPTARTPRVVQ